MKYSVMSETFQIFQKGLRNRYFPVKLMKFLSTEHFWVNGSDPY